MKNESQLGPVCLSYGPYYFSEGTIFFSHNKSANSTFNHSFFSEANRATVHFFYFCLMEENKNRQQYWAGTINKNHRATLFSPGPCNIDTFVGFWWRNIETLSGSLRRQYNGCGSVMSPGPSRKSYVSNPFFPQIRRRDYLLIHKI